MYDRASNSILRKSLAPLQHYRAGGGEITKPRKHRDRRVNQAMSSASKKGKRRTI
jgi:hypothetical protein